MNFVCIVFDLGDKMLTVVYGKPNSAMQPDVCLFATSLDYVSHVDKCIYRQMKTVAR